MDNPLLLPRSRKAIEAIHECARDLAYLVAVGMIAPDVAMSGSFEQLNDPKVDERLSEYRKKWNVESNYIPLAFLHVFLTFGFLEAHTIIERGRHKETYILTPKAFSLLEKPIKPPTIFISYRRKESSTFALLIEARLRLLGVDTVFIDKNINAGEEWHRELKERISQSQNFICLIGPTTLASEMVTKEIEWAIEAGSRIIAIWHNGFTLTDSSPQTLRDRQDIRVANESARDYETAISELLNSLGYRTY
jgi:hypothetical protein